MKNTDARLQLQRSQLRLPSRGPSLDGFGRSLCKVCDISDWRGKDWLEILDEIGLGWQRDIMRRHRKGWEWVQGMYGLRLLGFLDETVTALGIGAGKEYPVYYLANHVAHVLATDLYGDSGWNEAPRSMLDHPEVFAPFQYRRDHLSVQNMDGRKLDLNDNSFDVVFSFSSIEHFGGHAEASKAMHKIGRILRPGGLAVIATELILNGQPHQEYFLPGELYTDLIVPSRLTPVEEIDFRISDETLALGVVDVEKSDMAKPHIILRHDKWVWTSVILFLMKTRMGSTR